MPDLWAARLPGGSDPRARAFTGTVAWDWRLAAADLRGSLAHVVMLEQVGLITPGDAALLKQGLHQLLAEVASGAGPWNPDAEDVHTAVEEELTRRIGEPARRLHTGRSRNDQVALDLHLYAVDAARSLAARVDDAIRAVADAADRCQDLPMPGYTHMQRAQPVTVGHHLLAYAFMLLRDRERLAQVAARSAVSPLGAGALATSTLDLSPDAVAQALHFRAVYDNSLDAVSDRDFVTELAFACALVLTHLSRLGEEVVLWSTREFGFVTIDDAWATGSSMMPQKKNPDVAELLRGRAARGLAQLAGLLALQKGLPMAYNRDLQEDKGYLFQAHDAAEEALAVVPGLVSALHFNPTALSAALTEDVLATDAADRLVEAGVPFREAHGRVATSRSWDQPGPADPSAVADSLRARDRPMGPGPQSIARQLCRIRDSIARPV
jgi:argininosuccinate lyase